MEHGANTSALELADVIEGWDFPRECDRDSSSSASATTDTMVPCGLSSIPVSHNSLTDSLESCGFVVFDNAAGSQYANALRKEILDLFRDGSLQPSLNKLATARDASGVVSSGHELQKSGVWELDVVVNGEVRAPWVFKKAPCVSQFFHRDGPQLARLLTRGHPQLKLLDTVDTIKLQYNEGIGGCFPMHYDTSSAHSQREITAIIYLNPEWKAGDGGELRLFPFPLDVMDVAPMHDRLAVFNSTEMLHRVMPATAPRLCFSVWFSREPDVAPMCLPSRLPQQLHLPAEQASMLQFLLQPQNRRLLSKVLYGEDYAQSFKDAFGLRPEVDAALGLHAADVRKANNALSPELRDLVQQSLPLPLPRELQRVVEVDRAAALAPVDEVATIVSHEARADVLCNAAESTDHDASGGNAVPIVGGTTGALFNPAFLRIVQPLYDMHMGVENMAPLLYSLIRFTKPIRVLEVGAGYTSPFMLQALKDNYTEMSAYKEQHLAGKCTVGEHNMPWCVDEYMRKAGTEEHFGVLHCIDNLAHEHTTAHLVIEAAQALDALDHLDLYIKDAWEYAKTCPLPEADQESLDMVWLDFGQGDKLGLFIDQIWPRIRPGALVLCHSTLTNSLTRDWLETMRARANDVTDVLGPFATLSMREPHKVFQNSFSIFQKRRDFAEPVLTKYP
eukprot:m.252131 g.252131  ORF g.252131 m.252131 type:complete len:674 (-) comp19555_c0_seq1:426-2447(-)